MHINALKQHLDLCRRERHSAGAIHDRRSRGHGESPLLQAFGAEPEARTIPGHDFDAILVFADEDEDVAGIGVMAKGVLDHGYQRGATLAHIGGMAGEKDAPGTAEGQHGERSRTVITLRSRSRSTPDLMRTATPRGKRISTAELADADDGGGIASEGRDT